MNRTYSFQKAPRCSATSGARANGAKRLPCGAGRFAAFTGPAVADQGASATGCSSTGSTQKRP
jgi:hypothetical protein